MSTGNNAGWPATLVPFKPGVSGNPSGRPKSFGGRIRSLTKDGEELVQLALAIMRGETTAEVATKEGTVTIGPSIKERLMAVQWLADRGWGKAPDAEVEAAADAGRPLRELAVAELEKLASH